MRNPADLIVEIKPMEPIRAWYDRFIDKTGRKPSYENVKKNTGAIACMLDSKLSAWAMQQFMLENVDNQHFIIYGLVYFITNEDELLAIKLQSSDVVTNFWIIS